MAGRLNIGAQQALDRPPEALVSFWSQSVHDPAGDAVWRPLAGGRTNSTWRVTGQQTDVVVKLFRPAAQTPLFDNDPVAEERALVALEGSGLAPEFVGAGLTAAGPSLCYVHVDGRAWRPGDGAETIAQALARLHARPAPGWLGAAPIRVADLRRQAREMLAQIGAAGEAITALEPVLRDDIPLKGAAFLHGDATAGNALMSGGAITFIDWQCPARGDPVFDLAVFLSPAMQAVSGNRPLTPAEEQSFLDAYGEAEVSRRYRALAPLFHWRMAAYCRWRAARGDRGYAEAARLEEARLRAET